MGFLYGFVKENKCYEAIIDGILNLVIAWKIKEYLYGLVHYKSDFNTSILCE